MAWSDKSRHQRGYGTAWNKLRQTILTRDKHLCQSCKRKGRVKAGTHVDHIKPKSKGGTDDPGNLEAICHEHHALKTIRDSGGVPKPRIAVDGWPEDI